MRLVVKEVTIDAPVTLVYQLLTDPAHLVRWLADEADIEARPGGLVRWRHANGDVCTGQVVEAVPSRRLVFTYGWARPEVQIPPGSTTVEIDLAATPDGTRLRLTHHGLADHMAEIHSGGWAHYLSRLVTATGTGDPGPDPFVDQRVPTPAELRGLGVRCDG
ncbi:SRPBCC family protein [Salinispora arenicola]|uniref:Activator of Hsp90 ATPase 1 family protein n=1 Tax=Salinispora arenicola (strain CNS-205) TaxID=391037 RepID=A8LUT3_SALAI|nr:SRPBCC domain-containing protein [Salinispora arenicola]MCN0178171.1 SRPBCC domain-containing protein [Salinispora arenicola]